MHVACGMRHVSCHVEAAGARLCLAQVFHLFFDLHAEGLPCERLSKAHCLCIHRFLGTAKHLAASERLQSRWELACMGSCAVATENQNHARRRESKAAEVSQRSAPCLPRGTPPRRCRRRRRRAWRPPLPSWSPAQARQMVKRNNVLVRTDKASVTQRRACREPMVAGGGCFAVWAGCGYWCKLWKQVASLQHPRQRPLGYAAWA